MKIYEKKIKFFNFFEDVKLIEVDHDYNKLAIVFSGKENMIHIFDSTGYLDYLPIIENDINPNSDNLNESQDKINFSFREDDIHD